MNHVAIRRAVQADVEGIAKVHAAAWQAAFTFLPPDFLREVTADRVRGQWSAAIEQEAASMFVTTEAESVTGFLQVRIGTPPVAGDVLSLYVHPESWRHGVGTALLRFGETWMAERGARTATLWTAAESPQSRGFYERLGWVATGEETTQLLTPTVALQEVRYERVLS